MPGDLPPRAAAILARHPGPVHLGASRLKWIGVLAIGLVLGAGGGLMVRTSATDPRTSAAMGWFGVAFFGLVALVALVQLLPGASGLTLDADGFETTTLFRRHRHRWAETGAFGTWNSGHATLVAFEAAAAPAGRLGAVNRALAGGNASLPDTYGLRADDLVLLMEAWRRRSLEASSA